ncbi:hypothetical protein ASZ90_017069 [hydrocarbon metagenome]|uniref:Uncharacterized protein n=1 Tax=hydrocarbon metagenome TaxID=938273 RepID=A0A0W8EAD7_9ZZZZ
MRISGKTDRKQRDRERTGALQGAEGFPRSLPRYPHHASRYGGVAGPKIS